MNIKRNIITIFFFFIFITNCAGIKSNPDALSLKSWEKKWEFEIDKIGSRPAINKDGIIYAGSKNGKFYAISPYGVKKWEFETNGPIKSSPTIGPDGTIYFGSWDGKLYAIHPNGTKKWEFKIDNSSPRLPFILSSPTIGFDGTIYLGANRLYAINPDGTKKWEFRTNDWVDSSPVIASDGTIYFGSRDDKFYAVNPDGTKKWEFRTWGYVNASPAIAPDGTIYFVSHDGKLYAMNPNGTKKWEFQISNNIKSPILGRNSPIVGKNGIIYIALYYTIYVINPDGTPEGHFTADGYISSFPTIGADGTMYFALLEGNKLYSIRPDGIKKWEFEIDDELYLSSPIIGFDGILYIGGNKLYSIAIY